MPDLDPSSRFTPDGENLHIDDVSILAALNAQARAELIARGQSDEHVSDATGLDDWGSIPVTVMRATLTAARRAERGRLDDRAPAPTAAVIREAKAKAREEATAAIQAWWNAPEGERGPVVNPYGVLSVDHVEDALREAAAPAPIEAKHDAGCDERCNHCTVCGVGIIYGSRCPEHYLNRPAPIEASECQGCSEDDGESPWCRVCGKPVAAAPAPIEEEEREALSLFDKSVFELMHTYLEAAQGSQSGALRIAAHDALMRRVTSEAGEVRHDVNPYSAPTGWGWTCRCGAASQGMPGQRSELAARAAGLRHVRAAEDRARAAAPAPPEAGEREALAQPTTAQAQVALDEYLRTETAGKLRAMASALRAARRAPIKDSEPVAWETQDPSSRFRMTSDPEIAEDLRRAGFKVNPTYRRPAAPIEVTDEAVETASRAFVAKMFGTEADQQDADYHEPGVRAALEAAFKEMNR